MISDNKEDNTCINEVNNLNISQVVDKCANCGKEGTDLNTCNKCKDTKYCNAACKKKHKSKHKKKCERRVAALHDEALFKQPPPRDDCPICFLPLPLLNQTIFRLCCGKMICDGCDYTAKIVDIGKGKKKEETNLCPFCREPHSSSDEEQVERIKQLIERGNAEAHSQLALYCSAGSNGVPQDYTKANELWLKAGELGCAEAYFNLGTSYYSGRGVDVDKEKSKYYYELAAMGGFVGVRYLLGVMERQAGKEQRAYKHIIIAAKSGHKKALDMVKKGFAAGLVTKDEYQKSLRAYHEQQEEMKSKARDEAAANRERLAALRRG